MASPGLEEYQIDWICALSVEAAAAHEMLDEIFGIVEQQLGSESLRSVHRPRIFRSAFSLCSSLANLTMKNTPITRSCFRLYTLPIDYLQVGETQAAQVAQQLYNHPVASPFA
jgi:hypothetical protein